MSQSSLNENSYLRNIQDLLWDGKTPYETRFGPPFDGPIISFGSPVGNHPLTAKNQSGDQDLKTSTLIRHRSVPGESHVIFLGKSERSLPPLHDSFPVSRFKIFTEKVVICCHQVTNFFSTKCSSVIEFSAWSLCNFGPFTDLAISVLRKMSMNTVLRKFLTSLECGL